MTAAIERVFPDLRWDHGAGCLTLYLAAGPGWDASYYAALLKDIERDLASRADAATRPRIQEEMNRVRRFCEEVRPPGLPLAIFSCVPDALFEALRLPEDVASSGHFGTALVLEPLEEQLARHPPGLAVIVEKDQARVFAVVLDDVHQLGEVEGRKVSRTRRAGPHSSQRSSRQDQRLNIKQAVDLVVRSGLQGIGLEAIYLAGPVEARSAFKARLQEPSRRQIRSELQINPGATAAELADRIRKKV